MYSIGVDIGGTFTDFTVFNKKTGQILVEKCLSTPHRPEEAVLAGLQALAKRLPDLYEACARLNHATTLVTNAILERKGPKVALLTTHGFRDVLEMKLEFRYNVYDLFIRYPEPIIPRHLRYGVEERATADGRILKPLDESSLADAISDMRRHEVQSAAICYLHSYRNPEHERRTATILQQELPNVSISVSHEVDPEPREYERTSTTVLDAFVKPTVSEYLRKLEATLRQRGVKPELEIMLSNGGSTTAAIARNYPIQIIESGPAAGVEAAIWTCRHIGIPDALSFDMGGTTAKLCVIRDYLAGRSRKFEAGRVHRFVAGSGFPVSVSVYDLVEIGAGGGSIARVDNLGLIEVGPESAGAEPGPACYARGGELPSVTDADLVLGLLDPDYFLGGEMKLDTKAAVKAIEIAVARPLGIDVVAAAYGVYDIVNETMASAARLHIAEKGCDPGKLSVVAFGGAGPLHAIELARKLGCPRVIFPPNAGVMSSFGLLTAPPAFERMRTVKSLLRDSTQEAISEIVGEMEEEVLGILDAPRSDVEFRYIAEMWHHGQEYPIEVPFDPQDIGAELITTLRERFSQRYRELYGRVDDETPIEIANVRVIGGRPDQKVETVRASRVEATRVRGIRRVYEPRDKAFVEVQVLDRAALRPGEEIDGPIVIQERESGIVVRRGDRVRVHESGAVFVELECARA
jgi:N-methylhydantoinase A